MEYIKEKMTILSSLLVGSILYVGLSWIPIIGPLLVGIVAGWIRSGNSKEGFTSGLYSTFVGFVILILVFGHLGVFNTTGINTVVTLIIVGWILLLWITGMLFAGLGGIVGSMMLRSRRFSKERPKRIKIEVPPQDYTSYVICPNCGAGNSNSSRSCDSCGRELRG